MTTEFERNLYEQLYNNSIVFLNDGIDRLVSKDNDKIDIIEHNLLVLTCASFQISIELAIKALIVEKKGINSVIEAKYNTLSIDEIQDLFISNNLKTLEFDTQKNFIKSQNFIEDLTKEDFKVIDEFQKYRNKIVHFAYNFNDENLNYLKNNIIYYLINIVFKILLSAKNQDLKPSQFIEYILGSELHYKLMHYTPYINAMEKLAKEKSTKVYTCLGCENRTFSKDENYCYSCNFINDYSLINCDFCGEKNSVIYDNLNISLNDYMAKGLCLNCLEEGMIFECEVCGKAHNMETKFINVYPLGEIK